jgi:hypothetical protein
LPTEQREITIVNITYQLATWYISVKNAIIFLATFIFGLVFLSLFISEGFIVNDREGPVVLLLLPLFLATASFFGSVFFGKKIWGSRGNFRGSGDGLAKKTLIWIVSISIFLFLFLSLISLGGSGMGG